MPDILFLTHFNTMFIESAIISRNERRMRQNGATSNLPNNMTFVIVKSISQIFLRFHFSNKIFHFSKGNIQKNYHKKIAKGNEYIFYVVIGIFVI